ncbi:tail fiber domain-containing protein [Methylobacterium nonmethylotrophicum]|uniref:Tail fiber domain-containing protein n=1 Tax=Methylobacterium nonmethylotrophicum TaxID=1141884 RepID=A0A4Z0NF99_9HYPH|nr:tail fiber domain-containing protein [Methylobacterium nonmethylotrophicum]TGD94066.1 tail fiber domain-containing protein [Methylobacterium nonmethylotrophicum]
MGGKTVQTKTESSTQNRDPWAPAIPQLAQILTDAQAYYMNGDGGQVYEGQRVAGLGDTTQAGLDFLKTTAAAGQGAAQGANGLVSGLMASGGQTAGTKAAADAYSGISGVDTSPTAALASRMAAPDSVAAQVGTRLAGGNTVTTEGDYRGLVSGVSGPSQTQKSLQDVADGKLLAGNPYLDAITQRSSNAAASKVAAQMAASGRYGSGMMQNAVADAVSANENTLRYQNYDAERARQAQAASAIDSAGNARIALAQGLIGNIGATQAQNAGLALQGAQLGMAGDAAALSAAGQLAGQQATNAGIASTRASGLAGLASGDRAAALAGVSAVPGVQDALLAPGRTLAQTGAVQDAARQDQLNADMAKFDETQGAHQRGLAMYANTVLPIAGLGGSVVGNSVSRTETPNPGVFQSVLGGLTTAAGLIGRTSGGASGFAALPSIFATMSDERAKEDIAPVGETYDGQQLYAYRYKGDPRVQIGLMAQEVAEHAPEAVVEGPRGLLMVDYDRATRRARRA